VSRKITVHAQFTPEFGYQHFVELLQSYFPDYTDSLTFPGLWAFSLTLAEFPDISRFPYIPEKWLTLLPSKYASK